VSAAGAHFPLFWGELAETCDTSGMFEKSKEGKVFSILLKFSTEGAQSLDGTINRLRNPDAPLTLTRTVSLDNVFRHNTWMYEALVGCTDLLGDPRLPIAWTDFPDDFRREIEEVHKSAMVRGGGDFAF